MPIFPDLALVDTNVLIAAVFPHHKHHSSARSLFDHIQDGELRVCVSPQVLAEFFAVVTDSRRVTNPRIPEEALTAIEAFLAMPK